MQILKSLENACLLGVIVLGWVLISPGQLLYAKSVSEFAVVQEQMRAHQDAYTTHRAFTTPFGDLDYFAVFDGHGGPEGAGLGLGLTHAYARDHLHRHLHSRLTSVEVDPLAALTAAFVQADRAVCLSPEYDRSGSTASVMLVDSGRNAIYVANVGDSPIVLAYRDGRTQQISVDHNAKNLAELARVRADGFGDPLYLNRFAGHLMVSRALGNCDLKASAFSSMCQRMTPAVSSHYTNAAMSLEELLTRAGEFWISPFPSVQQIDMTLELEFAVIASDGVMDGETVDAATVVDYIREQRRAGRPLQSIAEGVIAEVKAFPTDQKDDKTIIIVYFQD